jgi:hypothetical protein
MCAENIKMKSRKLAIVAISILLFVATATVAAPSVITEYAFAKSGRYTGDTTSQAASVNNECLNPILDSNTIDNIVDVGNCGGTVSQQDESGQASATTTSQTSNPDIELQRATTQPPLGNSPTEETSPFGTVELRYDCVGVGCDFLKAEVFTNNALPPGPVSDPTFDGQFTFASPSTFKILFYLFPLPGEGNMGVTSSSPACPTVNGEPAVTANLPPAGATVECDVTVFLEPAP